MGYSSLAECARDLERHGHLVRVKEEVDPHLEMAAIHLRVHERGGPALLFENVKGSPFPAVSNLFGTMERGRFLFRDTLERVRMLVALKYDPMAALRSPRMAVAGVLGGITALPMRRRSGAPILHGRTTISKLPQIVSWPMDGG